MGDSDRDVSEGKLVSGFDGVSSNNDEMVEVSGDSDSGLGLLDTEVVNGSVLGVELSHLGDFDLVPVDPFVVVVSGSAELHGDSVNSSLSEFVDGSDHLLVSDDELGNDSLGASDHLSVLNLDGVDHLDDMSDGVVVFLGELDKVESTSVGSNVSGTVRDEGKFSFSFKVFVVDGVLDGSLGEFDKCGVFELEDLSLGDSNGSSSVGKSDSGVSNSGGVSELGSEVVETESELLVVSLGLESSVVLVLVEGSELHGVSGSNLGLEESFLGDNGTGKGESLVSLSLSLHGSLDLDLGGVDSLGHLASSDRVLGTDNSGSGGTDVHLGLLVNSSLGVDSAFSLEFSNSLHLSGVFSSGLSGNSSDSGDLGTSDFSNLASSLENSSGSGLSGNSSSDLGVLDGDLLTSLGGNSSLLGSNSLGMSMEGESLSSDLEESLSLGLFLISNSLSEEDISLKVSSLGPSELESHVLFSGHLTLE